MNEKRERAVNYLQRFRRLCENEKIIREQMFAIERLMSTSRTSTLSAVPVKGGGNRYEDYIVNQISNKDDLKVRLAIISGQKAVFQHIIDSLPRHEKAVIERFYITGNSRGAADDLMEKLEFEKSHIYRIRDKALDRICDMIDGFSEYDIMSLGIKQADE